MAGELGLRPRPFPSPSRSRDLGPVRAAQAGMWRGEGRAQSHREDSLDSSSSSEVANLHPTGSTQPAALSRPTLHYFLKSNCQILIKECHLKLWTPSFSFK